MRKPTAIAFVVMLTVALFSAIAFAAPLAGARRANARLANAECTNQTPMPNVQNTNGSSHIDSAFEFEHLDFFRHSPFVHSSLHDDAPRQAGRRTTHRIGLKQQDGENITPDAAPATTLCFATITVTIDPKGVPLAAYQFEISAGHAFTVVGLDNAGHPSFSDPPHYDRSAAAGGTDRLIIADYTTRPTEELIAKPQAAATIHAAFRVDEAADVDALVASVALTLTAAADSEGNRIDADITYELHLAQRQGTE